MVMTDLSFLAVLRNESCMFCVGLLSIGHSRFQIKQLKQPEKQKHRLLCIGRRIKLCPAGKAGVSGQPIRYGVRRAISTWMRDCEGSIRGRGTNGPFRENVLAQEQANRPTISVPRG